MLFNEITQLMAYLEYSIHDRAKSLCSSKNRRESIDDLKTESDSVVLMLIKESQLYLQ